MKLSKELREISTGGCKLKNDLIKYKVEVATRDENRTIVVDFFANEEYFSRTRWESPVAMHLRLILDKENSDLAWIYKDKKDKLHRHTAALGRYLYSSDYINISEADEKLLMEYLGVSQDDNHGLTALGVLTEEISEKKTAALRKKRGLFVDEEISLFSDAISDDVLRWVKLRIADDEKTLIYKKGNVNGLCYYCGCNVKATNKRFKQFEFVNCPHCGEKVMCSLQNGAAEKSHRVDTFIVPAKNGDVFLMRGFVLRRDPSAQYENIQEWIEEKERFAVRGKNLGCWTKTRYGWEKNKKRNIQNIYRNVYLRDFDELKKGTSLQYAEQGFFHKNRDFLSEITAWVRYPIIEKLFKTGYITIAQSIAYAPMSYEGMDPREESLKDFFRVPVSVLKNVSPTAEELSVRDAQRIQRFYSMGYDAEKIKLALAAEITADEAQKVTKYSSLQKVCRYIIEQNNQSRDRYKNSATDYTDYIHQLELLEENMKDKHILFPKNLAEAHRIMNERIRREQDKVEKNRIKKQDEEFAAKMQEYTYLNYADKKAGLTVIVPSSASQLKAEGKKLHHCVGGYINRVVSGQTLILFVRKTAAPSESFYTLEYKDGKIKQCRTKYNKDYRENAKVTSFVDKWLRYAHKTKGGKQNG